MYSIVNDYIKHLVIGSIVVCSFTLFFVPVSVSAHPFTILSASPGDTCLLPDGNSGQVETDGHTCCPSKDAGNDTSCLYDKYINPAIQLLAAAVGLAVVAAIIYGAIEYTSSGGDPQRAASGKKHITDAIIGLVAFFLLYAFLQFILPGGILHG